MIDLASFLIGVFLGGILIGTISGTYFYFEGRISMLKEELVEVEKLKEKIKNRIDELKKEAKA